MTSKEEAQEFNRWKRDDTIDNTHLCNSCGKYYDYRIFMVHRCKPVASVDNGSFGYVNTV